MPKRKITEQQIEQLRAAIEQLEPLPPTPPSIDDRTEDQFLERALASAEELLAQGLRPAAILERWARDGIPLDKPL